MEKETAIREGVPAGDPAVVDWRLICVMSAEGMCAYLKKCRGSVGGDCDIAERAMGMRRPDRSASEDREHGLRQSAVA